ncbi:MAG: hypothetical protein R2771_07395 [Saprospiraceae bacterium]
MEIQVVALKLLIILLILYLTMICPPDTTISCLDIPATEDYVSVFGEP